MYETATHPNRRIPAPPKPCAQCGKMFRTPPSTNRVYCSKACQAEGARGRPLPANLRRVEATCANCGGSFTVRPHEIRNGRRYCSRACGSAGRKGQPMPAEQRAKISAVKTGRNLGPRRAPISVICQHCGQPFTVGKDRASVARYCSQDCYHAAVKADPTKNPAYKHGNQCRSYPYGKNWKARALRARERDNHTCQGCGKRQRSPQLDVHHIQPRREFGRDKKAADSIDNLITLCKPCHGKWEAARRIGGEPDAPAPYSLAPRLA